MTQQRSDAMNETNWRPLAWVLLGAAIVLVLASFTGNGTGMFGWGWMMGMMWLWMLLPVLLVVWLVVYVTDRTQQVGERPP